MNDQFAKGSDDPVSRRKASQRTSALAAIKSSVPSLDAGQADDSSAAPADDQSQPLPATDPSVAYNQKCATCNFFVADGQPCQKVSDPVTSDGHCKMFEGGSDETQPQDNPDTSNPYASSTGPSTSAGPSAGGIQSMR